MRIVIVGAGAIGGSLAAELSLSGADILVVARGEHGQKIAEHGLRYLTPHADRHVKFTRVSDLRDLTLRRDDFVVLTMKLDDVEAAARALATIDADVPVLCLQNGVAGEAIAAKYLHRVYAGMVYLPATYLEAGRVENYCSNRAGTFRIGSYQGGDAETSEALSALLVGAGFQAAAVEDIMSWKYGKLLTNLGNAMEVSCSDLDQAGGLYQRAQLEGEACFRAAGIDYLSADEIVAAANIEIARIAGKKRPGGSMWQSVARHRPPEVAYLNGEIVRLGLEWGVATPVNRMLLAAVDETVEIGARWTAQELANRV
jgi:2-dehydropantoate 2-reductase